MIVPDLLCLKSFKEQLVVCIFDGNLIEKPLIMQRFTPEASTNNSKEALIGIEAEPV